MTRLTIVCIWAVLLALQGVSAQAANYQLKKVTDSVYAAIAQQGGKATSNALVIITPHQVTLVGSHFVRDGIRELLEEIAELTPIPLREVIITHHHKGYRFIDSDFPASVELIVSWQTWHALKSEQRKIDNPLTYFDHSLTMIRDGLSIILSNTERGHSEGDVIVYIPEQEVLFTSDLFFNDIVGYMGDGHLWDWSLSLELLKTYGARIVVPGLGEITDNRGIERFHLFFRDFISETLRHVERGASLEKTRKEFNLPQYKSMPGFRMFFDVNVERTYRQLKEK